MFIDCEIGIVDCCAKKSVWVCEAPITGKGFQWFTPEGWIDRDIVEIEKSDRYLWGSKRELISKLRKSHIVYKKRELWPEDEYITFFLYKIKPMPHES